ncbi:MAG: sulfotransferase [Methyloceanibacter sp.]
MTRLVYIGGFGQSGSTLFESLLTASPAVVACGEIANGFEGRTGRELKCTCGKLAKDCPIWGVFARGSNASLNHEALVLALLEHVDGKYAILVDSSKTAWGSITAPFRLRRALGPRFFLLHQVRNPRAVCWSTIRLPLIKTRRKKQPTPIERALAQPVPRCLRTAAGWWIANLACEIFGWLYPRQYLRLSYEDIAAAPREALRRLFASVAPDLSVEFAEPEETGNRHQIYGNRMRRKRLRFADVRLDDGWKTEMAPSYRRLAGALSWPLRARYGY